MEKQFFFLGGLPRSGSTLLASLLSQNPEIYTSPNSPLVALLVNVGQHLINSEQSRAFMQPTQRVDVLQSSMDGMYRFTDRPIIIDKSRAWPHPHNLAILTEVLDKPVKVIATVRDLPSVMASFIRKIHEHPDQISFIDKGLRSRGVLCTDEARAHALFSPGGTVHNGWNTLKQALDEGWGAHIHLVEYDELVNSPDVTLKKLYDFLEIPDFTHDYTNIKNTTQEDDEVYSIPGLHSVRPELKKTAPDPQKILGKALYDQYASEPHFWRTDQNIRDNSNPLLITTDIQTKS